MFYAQDDASTDTAIVPAQHYLYSSSFAIVLFSFWNIRKSHEFRKPDAKLLGLSEGAWVYICVFALVCSGHIGAQDPMILQVVFVCIFGVGSIIGILAEVVSAKKSSDMSGIESVGLEHSSAMPTDADALGAKQRSYGSLQQNPSSA